jgi:guanylate kinase
MATGEMKEKDKYDYVVFNNEVEDAVKEIKEILLTNGWRGK